MSIIHEALEKAQSSLKPAGAAVIETPVKATPHTEKPAPNVHHKPDLQKKVEEKLAVNSLLPTVALILLIACALILGVRFLSKATGSSTITGARVQESSYRPIAKTDVAATNTLIENVQQAVPSGLLRPLGSPDLVLNGIMYLDDGPRAIINNDIVGAGDSVSGAKVIKINRQNVILEYRDVEITLNLK